jgi:hypothetical protein
MTRKRRNGLVGHGCHICDVRVTRGECELDHILDEIAVTEVRKVMWFISFHRSNRRLLLL